MAIMKKLLMSFMVLVIMVGFAACQGDASLVVDSVSATATAQGMYTRLPVDVPVMDGAYALKVSSSGNSISYRVDAVFEDVIAYYQQETVAMGWEQLGGEQVMAGSITMQRTKPDKNMSILISTIQGTSEIIVQVMIASR
jgi:hypothetical protein